MAKGTGKHIFISTDLEPDDMLGLKYILKHFDKNNTYHILVGEGEEENLKDKANFAAHFLNSAVIDNLISEDQKQKNFEILIGSPTRKEAYVDPAKAYYQKHFLNQFSESNISYKKGEEALEHIKKTIESAKKEDKDVTIFLWKPMQDMPDIVNNLLKAEVLTKSDTIAVSGSYNVRELREKEKTSKLQSVDDMLNNGITTNVLFEAFPTYEQKENTPKHILHSREGDVLTSAQKANDKVAEFMLGDNSALGELANQGRSIWNRGVSEDCIAGCLDRVIGAAKDAGANSAVSALEAYKEKLGETIADDTKSIGEINQDFVKFLNQTLSTPGLFSAEEISNLKETYPARKEADDFKFLLGTETKKEYILEEFKTKLGSEVQSWDQQNVERIIGFYDYNFKVLEAIIRDPNEMIIGDATCAVYAQHSEFFDTEKSLIEFANTGGRLAYANEEKSPAQLPEGNCEVIRGVNSYENLMDQLILGAQVADDPDAT